MAVWDVAVVGIDGCRDGWIAVAWRDGQVEAYRWDSLEELSGLGDVAVAAIDIPLGLSPTGERLCDSLARSRLGVRASTIFNAPPRACVAEVMDYDRANAISRLAGGRGLSRQSFGLLAKIREADRYWRRAPCPLYEVHPELAFARLNAGRPLVSKKSWAGVMTRRELLAGQGITLDHLGAEVGTAAPDDVLDAAVCALSALRIERGEASCLPQPPEVDETGREMSIRY